MSFWWPDVLPDQPAWIKRRNAGSGNLFSGSWIPPLYHTARLVQESRFISICSKCINIQIDIVSVMSFRMSRTVTRVDVEVKIVNVNCSGERLARRRTDRASIRTAADRLVVTAASTGSMESLLRNAKTGYYWRYLNIHDVFLMNNHDVFLMNIHDVFLMNIHDVFLINIHDVFLMNNHDVFLINICDVF